MSQPGTAVSPPTHGPLRQDASWRAHYPFASHYHQLECSPGNRLHYIDEGEGEPVLMLHGNPTWSFYYRKLASALRPTHRVVVPDHLGCGMSSKPQDHPYQLAQHVDHVVELADALGLDGINLVIHDWGGPIGMGLAARRPERIKRIVVLNTAAFLSTRCPWRIRACRIPLLGPLMVRGFNAFAGSATWMAVSKRLARDVRAGYVAPYDSWANRIATLRFVEDIPLSPKHPTYQTVADIEAALPKFKDHPMMIVWGMRDWCFDPVYLAGWRERFPDAEVTELADAHHLVLEDAPDEVIPRVLDFFAR